MFFPPPCISEIRRVSRPYQIVVSRSHPAMMVSPDLSQWYFNRMCGLGDKEHNRRVREERERELPANQTDGAAGGRVDIPPMLA